MKTVAIVGRPNVGKSTLFNKLCRSRRAIVADVPGITRDRLYGQMDWQGRRFQVVDTGGVVPGDPDLIRRMVLDQATIAIKESCLILFVVNGRDGLTPLDEEVAGLLRPYSARVAVLVNQLDSHAMSAEAAPFFRLGMDQVFPISAEHRIGLGDVLDYVAARLDPESAGSIKAAVEEENTVTHVAIVGRPNVGKSTLLNRLVGQERAIVSDQPGTTRDTVDSWLTHDGRRYCFLDTAGIRRKGRTSRQIESLSVIMAKKSLKIADVAVLLLDAGEGATKLDADIAGLAYKSGCSILLVFNKWDLVSGERNSGQRRLDDIRRRMKFLDFAPILTISALNGHRVKGIYRHIQKADEARCQRIVTGKLNNQFLPRVREYLLNSGRAQSLEVNFLTQAGIAPPTFITFLKGKTRLHFSIERFLENQLRQEFGFYATPIRIVQRMRCESKIS